MQRQNVQDNNFVTHIGRPLEKLFSSLHDECYETLGRSFSSPSSEDLALNIFTTSIFSPGTLSCLNADKNLMYPTLLLFINKFTKGYGNEIGRKASLLVSAVPSDEFVFRIIAHRLRIGIKRLRKGLLIDQDWPKLTLTAGQIHDSHIYSLNEEPNCWRTVLAPQNDSFKGTKHLKNVYGSSSDEIPFGLIIIHEDSETLKDEGQKSPALMSRLEGLRAIATEFQLAIIVTHNIQDQMASSIPADFEKNFDYQMELRAEANRYKLSVSHRKNGLVGTIPLVMFPEIGVMED